MLIHHIKNSPMIIYHFSHSILLSTRGDMYACAQHKTTQDKGRFQSETERMGVHDFFIMSFKPQPSLLCHMMTKSVEIYRCYSFLVLKMLVLLGRLICISFCVKTIFFVTFKILEHSCSILLLARQFVILSKTIHFYISNTI